MVSKSKLYARLDVLEQQLEEGLLPHLNNAAEGKNDFIFCVDAFNTNSSLKGKTDKLTEEFIGMGSQILSLRQKLGESSEGTIAERICWYCRQWTTTNGPYSVSTPALARDFIKEIENAQRGVSPL